MVEQARWSPAEYHTNNQVQLGHAAHIINKLDWRKYSAILDVGAGDGKITYYLAQKAPQAQVVGLDSDSAMKQFAEMRYSGQPNLSFCQDKIESSSLQGLFDLVVSFSTLHWIKDQSNAMRGIANALKSNGEFHAILYPRCPYHDAALDSIMQLNQWSPYFKDFEESFFNYDSPYYMGLFSELPFSDYQANRQELEPFHFDSIQSLINFMGAWLPQSRHLPKQLADEFLLELCTEYIHNLKQNPKGEIQIPFALIILRAIKS